MQVKKNENTRTVVKESELQNFEVDGKVGNSFFKKAWNLILKNRILTKGLVYDDKKRFYSFLLHVLSCSGFCLCCIGAMVYYLIRDNFPLMDIIVMSILITLSLIGPFIFYLFAKTLFELALFLFNSAITGAVITFIILLDGGRNYHTVIMMLFYVPYLSLVHSRYFLHKVFWISVLLVGLTVFMGWDSLLFTVSHELAQKNAFKRVSPVLAFIYQAFLYYSPATVLNVAIFMLFEMWNKQKRVVLSITEAVQNLDVDSDLLKKIKLLRTHKSTEIEKIFKKIIANFEEYITYLPENLKHNNYVVEQLSSTQQESSSQAPSKVSSGKSVIIEGQKAHFNKGSGVNRGTQNKYTKVGLRRRKVAYMIVNIKRLHHKLFNHDGKIERILDSINRLVLLVHKCVNQYNGIVEFVSDTYIVASWNSARLCISKGEKACKCACLIVNSKLPFQVRVTVSMGSAYCGNVGIKSCKRFSVISPIVDFAARLKNINYSKQFSEVIMSEEVYEEVKFIAEARVINLVKYKGKTERIYKLHGMKEINEKDEWMYQISTDLDEPEDKEQELKGKWDDVWKMIEGKQFDEAYKLMMTNFEKDLDSPFIIEKIKNKESVKQMMW